LNFDGRFEHLLDPKARVVVPARLRGGFATRKAHVTAYMGGCLAVWTPEGYERLYLSLAHKLQKHRPDMSLALSSHSEDIELDAQWRLTIPPELIEYAKLELGKPLVVAGNVNHIELWRPDEWAKRTGPCLDELRRGTSDLFALLFSDGGDESEPSQVAPAPVGAVPALAGEVAP
jgi:MraZ protein